MVLRNPAIIRKGMGGESDMSLVKSTMNQISNSDNRFQGSAKRVLCVCSAGMLRSPTLANILHKELGYNTRAVGTASEYALTPMSEMHVAWAQEIIFVDSDCKDYLNAEDWEFIKEWDVGIITLNVEDNYSYSDPELERILFEQYCNAEKE